MSSAIELPLHLPVRHQIGRPHTWLELLRFGAVGATGCVVNLAVFAVCVHPTGLDYGVSAVIAWVVSVLNKFLLNRSWAFAPLLSDPI